MNNTFRIVVKGEPGSEALLDAMHHLRWRVFVKGLGWKTGLYVANERERDDYDDPDAHYLLEIDDQGAVVGCARFRPTTLPYMLKERYEYVLEGRSAPVDPLIWEVSKFCIAPETRDFGRVKRLLFACMEHGVRRGIKGYIALATEGIERMPRHAKWPFDILSSIHQTGEDKSHVFMYHISAATLQNAFKREGIVGSLLDPPKQVG